MTAKNIYLDYAAATPVDTEVLRAMQPYFTEKFYNPSATYLAGRGVRRELDGIRQSVASTVGAKPAEIIFTAGATEANNLAIQGIMNRYPEGEVLVSAIEHESVLEPARLFRHKEIPADNNGIIKLNKLSNLINGKTVLISVMLVNNELGTIQPLREASEIVNEVRRARLEKGNELPLLLHTDAAQAGNFLDLHASRLGIDLMSINGGKIYGPKQSGALFVKTGVRLMPMIVGGGQESGLRSGTENPAAAAGLASALQAAQERRPKESMRIMKLRQGLEELIIRNIPGSVINGSPKRRAPHVTSLTIPGQDNEKLMMQLDEAGIQCAVGSACSAARQEASHVLSAIGLSEEAARATLRISLGRHTTESDTKKLGAELHRLTVPNR